jgi:hypothetical protein
MPPKKRFQDLDPAEGGAQSKRAKKEKGKEKEKTRDVDKQRWPPEFQQVRS